MTQDQLNEELLDVVYKNDIEGVRKAIEDGAGVNEKNDPEYSPLRRAATWGYTEIVKVLIEKGADLNANNKNGRTPLHWAVFNGHTEIAKMLIEAGADVNAVDDGGATPLDYAQESEFLELQALLVEYGGKPGECLSLAEIKATNAIAYQVALRASKPEENDQPFFQLPQNSNTQENPL